MKDLQFSQDEPSESASCDEIVVVAWHEDQLVLVRKNDEETWSFPACEPAEDEDAADAAERVMYEQTGAEEFQLYPLTYYSYTEGRQERNGQLFTAEIIDYEDLPEESEITEILLFDELPEESDLSNPFLHPELYKYVLECLRNSISNI